MAQTPEGKVKARLTKELKKLGVYYFFPATWGMGRSGVPDVICCVRGMFIAIECKAGKNKPTELQRKEMALIEGSGGKVFVCNEDTVDSTVEFIKLCLDIGVRQ